MTSGESGDGGRPPLRRAVILMTISSVLVPAGGVLTQPLLAHGLGVEGRGQLAAGLAPSLLALNVATLGLPDALTYFVAKRSRIIRPALLWASVLTALLGCVCLLVAYLALPFLSARNAHLGHLILLAIGLTIPATVFGVFRGVATGRQMWREVAVERVVNIAFRVVALGVLLGLGKLSVLAALVVTAGAPIVSGLVYWRLLLRPAYEEDEEALDRRTMLSIVSYGNRVWLGSVASMLLSRLAQILMVPLSSVADLGLYSVATTISDLPLVVALAIAGALFGVNSAARDAAQIALTARLTLFVNVAGCLVLGVTTPWWIGPVFGGEFRAATVPTLMLLLSAVVCIPGLMAATGIGAWGRPGLRSLGLTITLLVNLGVFVMLVPRLGVLGACWTSLVSNTVMTVYMVLVAARVMGVPARDFALVRRSDVERLRREGIDLLAQVRHRRWRTAASR